MSNPANVDIAPNDYERTKRAAFAITSAFEGGAYDAYNTIDRGIVSYGLFQFTLASGSLEAVLRRYIQTTPGLIAKALNDQYMPRIKQKDATLRTDTRLKNMLRAAANDQGMKDAQHAIATAMYWDEMIRGYVQPRGGLRLPLTYALLFDMAIHFGTNHSFVRAAEDALRVPQRSRPGQNGITEEQLVAKITQLRKASHDAQAARENLPGLRVRGDFWVRLVGAKDWHLSGDTKGLIQIRTGQAVQVRSPI